MIKCIKAESKADIFVFNNLRPPLVCNGVETSEVGKLIDYTITHSLYSPLEHAQGELIIN